MAKKFNTHNPTEMRLINVLSHGEGLISRDEFVALSNKTMLSRYKSEGYIKQAKNAEKGIYTITNKFKAEYCAQIDPFHRFSGSHSVEHAAGVNRVLSQLPADAVIQTGSEIQAQFKVETLSNSSPVYARMDEIRRLCGDHLNEARHHLNLATSDADRAMRQEEVNTLQQRYSRLLNVHKRWSTPDLRVTLNHDQLQELIAKTEEHYDRYHGSEFHRSIYDLGIQRMMELSASGENSVTLNIEIITNNYGWMDIDAKETWQEATDSAPVIYIAA